MTFAGEKATHNSRCQRSIRRRRRRRRWRPKSFWPFPGPQPATIEYNMKLYIYKDIDESPLAIELYSIYSAWWISFSLCVCGCCGMSKSLYTRAVAQTTESGECCVCAGGNSVVKPSVFLFISIFINVCVCVCLRNTVPDCALLSVELRGRRARPNRHKAQR